MEVAPAGAVTLVVAKATTPAGAAVTAAAEAAPADSAAAAAARASKVLLLRLPGGRPRLRGTGGVAAGTFALFLLPNGRPRLRPPDPLGTLAPALPKALVYDMEAKRMSWRSRGNCLAKKKSEGAWEWGENPRELRDFKERRDMKS
jgi:hypothetical protein